MSAYEMERSLEEIPRLIKDVRAAQGISTRETANASHHQVELLEEKIDDLEIDQKGQFHRLDDQGRQQGCRQPRQR